MDSLEKRRARFVLSVVISLSCFVGISAAQYGTAPSNYYPASYSGSIFTGKLTSTTDNTLTLTYTRGDKTVVFEGRVDAPCNVPVSKTTTRPMPLTALPKDVVVTAFYEGKTIKVNGQKQKENHVIAISFQEAGGKPVAEAHQAIFYCLDHPGALMFKAFQ